VGSVLCASAARVAEAREIRRQLGGAMRQVGVLAAAALVALREGPARLPADHARARRLAEALAVLPGVEIDPATVETNIGILRVVPDGPGDAAAAARWIAAARASGVLMSPLDAERVRFVTHRDLSDADLDEAIRRLRGLR